LSFGLISSADKKLSQKMLHLKDQDVPNIGAFVSDFITIDK